MGGPKCNVPGCNNIWGKTGNTVSYHRFPKNKAVQKVWVEKCNRPGRWNPNTSFICSEHFAESDYEHDLRMELMNEHPKKRLLKSAFPSLKIPCKDTAKRKPIGTPKRKCKGRRRKQDTSTSEEEEDRDGIFVVDDIELPTNLNIDEEDYTGDMVIDCPELNFEDSNLLSHTSADITGGCHQCYIFEEENKHLKNQISALEQENALLRGKLEEANEATLKQLSNLKFSVVMQNNVTEGPPPLLLLKK